MTQTSGALVWILGMNTNGRRNSLSICSLWFWSYRGQSQAVLHLAAKGKALENHYWVVGVGLHFKG